MCKRATEAHDSYVNAPRLYRTNDDGEREYLDEERHEGAACGVSGNKRRALQVAETASAATEHRVRIAMRSVIQPRDTK